MANNISIFHPNAAVFPLEILCRILQLSDRDTLRTAALVSRAFYREAVRWYWRSTTFLSTFRDFVYHDGVQDHARAVRCADIDVYDPRMAKQQDWDWLEDVLDVLEECPHLSAVHLRIGDGSCWKPLVNAPKGFSENQSNIVEYFLDSRIPAYIRSLDLSIHYPLARISSELCDFGDKFPELEKLRISARLLPDGQSPLYGSGLPKLSDFTILRCGDLPFALGSPLETLRITVAEFAEDQNSLEVFANTLERFQDTLKCLIVEIPLPRQKNATAEEELVTRVLSRMVKVYLPNLKRAEFSLQWHKTWSILAHDKVSVNERLSEIMSSFSPATEEFLSSLETLSVLGVHIEHEKIGMLTDVCFMHLPALRCLTFDNFASEGHGQMTFAGTLDRGVNVNRLYDIV